MFDTNDSRSEHRQSEDDHPQKQSNVMPRKQILEIGSAEQLQRWIDAPDRPIAVQGVSLSGWEQRLTGAPLNGCLFLGCEMSDALAGYLVAHRAIVIPPNWDFEFSPHRAKLYDVDALFAGFDPDVGEFGNFEASLDQRVYRQYEHQGRETAGIDVTLARRLHDHSITDARNEFVDGRKMVAIMGGHDLLRGSELYRDIARLSRSLTRSGYTLASGGGPGAMEATHVGAYFASHDDESLRVGLEMLAERRGVVHEHKEYADKDWLQRAFRVREKFPVSPADTEKTISLAIPTWFYGHEPPAPFATHIAKYFCNSVREDGLLQIAKRGVIFAPGNAGTVQEIFQDAAQNYYQTFSHASPMVLLGSSYWTTQRPAWELLKALAETPGKEHMSETVHMVDTVQDAQKIIESFAPPSPESL